MEPIGPLTAGTSDEGRAPVLAVSRLRQRSLDLPPIPSSAVRLIQLLASDDVALSDVTATIAVDAAIALDVLRAANTAYYGVRGEVTCLQHATTLLGVDRIRSLAAAIGLRRYLGQALKVPAVQRCWRHNLACAATAEQIARRLGGNAAEAFSAGLLHDVGRLALVVAHPKQYPALLDSATVAGFDMLALEHDAFGIDHCEAGHWVAEQLLLPQVFQDVALHHHDQDTAHLGDMVIRVGVACRLAAWMGFSVAAPSHLPAGAGLDPRAEVDRIMQPLAIAHRATLISEIADLVADVDEQVSATESVFRG